MKVLDELQEQIRLTNLALKEVARMLETGEWQDAEQRVIKMMLDE